MTDGHAGSAGSMMVTTAMQDPNYTFQELSNITASMSTCLLAGFATKLAAPGAPLSGDLSLGTRHGAVYLTLPGVATDKWSTERTLCKPDIPSWTDARARLDVFQTTPPEQVLFDDVYIRAVACPAAPPTCN